MTTDRQRAANQHNGRLARGPKTEAGKRASSLNAIRHGLSSQTVLDSLNPRLKLLSQVILEEVGNEQQARLIAAKIIDYERNEASQLEVAQRELPGEDGFVDWEAVEKERNESTAFAIWGGQMDQQLQQKGLSKHKKEELRIYRDALKFLTGMNVRREKQIVADGLQASMRLRRYYKRASNQLIKAIKHTSSSTNA